MMNRLFAATVVLAFMLAGCSGGAEKETKAGLPKAVVDITKELDNQSKERQKEMDEVLKMK